MAVENYNAMPTWFEDINANVSNEPGMETLVPWTKDQRTSLASAPSGAWFDLKVSGFKVAENLPTGREVVAVIAVSGTQVWNDSTSTADITYTYDQDVFECLLDRTTATPVWSRASAYNTSGTVPDGFSRSLLRSFTTQRYADDNNVEPSDPPLDAPMMNALLSGQFSIRARQRMSVGSGKWVAPMIYLQVYHDVALPGLRARDAGVWRTGETYVKDAGVWKLRQGVQVFNSGQWKEVP